jgi:hypothetical protein
MSLLHENEALLCDYCSKSKIKENASFSSSRGTIYIPWRPIFVFLLFSIITILLTFVIADYQLPKALESISLSRDSKLRFKTIHMEPVLTEKPITPGAEVISITYGPYTTAPHSMRPQGVYLDIKKPCVDCYVLAMHALLQDKNGTEIFTDSGMWLHHIIFFNEGRVDLVCPQMAGERFYGGGNERWTRRWNTNGMWGYKVDEGNRWHIVVEVMNDADVEQTVNIVVRYEVLPMSMAQGYRGIAAVWLDVTGCGDAEVNVGSTTKPFKYQTPEWVSSVDGVMVDVGGHMHDGGMNMTMYRNNDPVCESVVLYDNQVQPLKQHIIGSGICKDAGDVRAGDVLSADATYDPNVHQLVTHGGIPDPVMGSMGVYIGLI